MKENKAPYQKMIWVCANVRTDGKIACANEGRQGQEILDALKDKVKELGLKGKVRVARSGCLNLCAQGPNLVVYPEGLWYSGVSLEDLPPLIQKHLAPLRPQQ